MRQTDDVADAYAQIAELYDLEHDTFSEDLAMYRQVVEMVGDPVLELACGTGRILADLAQSGRRLSGSDLSATMLERARLRLAKSPGRVELSQADMATAASEPGAYGVVIVGLSSFHHATSQVEQIDVLRAAFDALDPRGMLVLDLLNPIAALAAEGGHGVRLERVMYRETGVRVKKFSSQLIDAPAQMIQSTVWYDIESPHGIERISTDLALRLVSMAELDLMLRAAGFATAEYYGSYELDPFTVDSPRLIAMAEKSI